MLKTIGLTFPKSSQWHTDQISLMHSLGKQIEDKFLDANNVLVNMTWFGPQFENGEYDKFLEYASNTHIDNLFLLASEDPCYFNQEETFNFIKQSKAGNSYLLGQFDSDYNFNFHSVVIPKYFYPYTEDQITMKDPEFVFICYNRKPREHRTKLVDLLDSNHLSKYGVVTLGDNRTLGESVDEIGVENQWWPEEHGIPHDIHSLGRLDIWQNHFLNVISETDYEDFLWTFVSEKTWKPIIGLRPFVINGQSAVYKWLTNNGFRTFNKYWSHIDLETCNIDEIHSNICSVIQYLKTQDLKQMYLDMLPDLRYNKERFYKFSTEQKHKMENLFG